MILPDEMYVVVAEHGGGSNKNGAPIVWESYIDENSSRMESLCLSNFIKCYHGVETTIAKLVLVEDDLPVE